MKTEIWIAICVYVLIAIIKKRLKLEASLHSILQILSITLFEKLELTQALTLSVSLESSTLDANQLIPIRLLTGQ